MKWKWILSAKLLWPNKIGFFIAKKVSFLVNICTASKQYSIWRTDCFTTILSNKLSEELLSVTAPLLNTYSQCLAQLGFNAIQFTVKISGSPTAHSNKTPVRRWCMGSANLISQLPWRPAPMAFVPTIRLLPIRSAVSARKWMRWIHPKRLACWFPNMGETFGPPNRANRCN